MRRSYSTGEAIMIRLMQLGAAAIAVGFIALWGISVMPGNTYHYQMPAAPKPIANPLKGWAPWIGYSQGAHPFTMEFVLWTWSEIEPEEGVFAFEALEQKLEMAALREQGRRFIIRIVSDYPSDDGSMDIPEWLYEKTYRDGAWYDNSYGKGYSPDYNNPILIEAHAKLIQAFAARYQGDPSVAWVELGSLGHWGEWHVDTSAGITPFPFSAVTDRYVQHYIDGFGAGRLLLRRPYAIGASAGMGLYNDSFGKMKSHEQWLGWIEQGYVSDQNQEQLPGMKDFWKIAPSGGEIASSPEEEYYFGEGFAETMELLYRSHTTFIGPHGGAKIEDESLSEQIDQMSREMGYCFQIHETTLHKKFLSSNYQLIIKLENTGIAPIYENWPLLLEIRDEQGTAVWEQRFDINLNQILPGRKELSLILENVKLASGNYTVQAGLIDPMTDRPGIKLANGNETEGCLYQIMEFSVK